MSITEVIAVIIGIVMVVERLILLVSPKTHKKAWKAIAKSPDSSVRMMGAGFIILGAVLIAIVLQTVDISEVVVAALAGWFLFLGSYAFAAKPLKAALNSFQKTDKRLIQLANVLVAVVGALIVYSILK